MLILCVCVSVCECESLKKGIWSFCTWHSEDLKKEKKKQQEISRGHTALRLHVSDTKVGYLNRIRSCSLENIKYHISCCVKRKKDSRKYPEDTSFGVKCELFSTQSGIFWQNPSCVVWFMLELQCWLYIFIILFKY